MEKINLENRLPSKSRDKKLEDFENPDSDKYYVHTDCARIALFSSYMFITCEGCKKYYERIRKN